VQNTPASRVYRTASHSETPVAPDCRDTTHNWAHLQEGHGHIQWRQQTNAGLVMADRILVEEVYEMCQILPIFLLHSNQSQMWDIPTIVHRNKMVTSLNCLLFSMF